MSEVNVIELRPVDLPVKQLNDYASETLREEGHFRAAITTTKRAIHICPTSKELWANLGAYFWHVHELDEAQACLERSLALDPYYYLTHGNLALVYQDRGELDLAEESFTKAIDLKGPNGFPLVQWCRGLLRLARGDYAGGFADYECRTARQRHGKYVMPQEWCAPLWKGEPLAGKEVYVPIEQGIGDTLMFSRWLPIIAREARKVYLCASANLAPMLWGYHGVVEIIPEGIAIPKVDYCALLGSLPHQCAVAGYCVDVPPPDPGLLLRRARQQRDIGRVNLPAPNGEVEGSALKVGICWTGNPEMGRNAERSIPFHQLLDLAADPRIWLYSLQAGHGVSDIAANGAEHLVYDLGSHLLRRGLQYTADVLLQLDAVVTCCTSIAHLAGALGVPAIVVLCAEPYWVWGLSGSSTPWYPSLTLVRQKRLCEWADAIAEVRVELAARIASLKSAA